MTTALAFGFVAACALFSAVCVVRNRNLVHAALWLGVTLLATAALYAMLDASFLAGVQVLLYVGGVSILMIFGVMITRKHDGIVVDAESAKEPRAALAAFLLFCVVAVAVQLTPDLDAPVATPSPITARDLGRGLLVDHVLAFEVISLLLLVAIVGAIVIARRRDPGEAAVGFLPRPRRTGERNAEVSP